MFVVLGLNPSHHSKAPDVVEIDGFEPKETEIGKVYPVAAILVASHVSLPSARYIVLTVAPRLPDDSQIYRSNLLTDRRIWMCSSGVSTVKEFTLNRCPPHRPGR